MGARTIVCEIDPVKALEAVMDGHQVMKMDEAVKEGDFFVTLTGGLHAIGKSHLENMKDGAIVANSGHFNVEIDLESLEDPRAETVINFFTFDCEQIFAILSGIPA